MLTAFFFLLLLQSSAVDRAIEMTAAEVKFSRIAENRAHHDRVRDFARMLERDHTRAPMDSVRQKPSGSVTAIAPLNKNHQKKVDQLSRLSGEEFDRVFIEAIIKEHKEAIRVLEQLTDDVGTQQALALLPELQQHLREAEAIKIFLRSPLAYGNSRTSVRKLME
jgi:putative membrane protein